MNWTENFRALGRGIKLATRIVKAKLASLPAEAPNAASVPPAKNGRLVGFDGFGENPGRLRMLAYLPPAVAGLDSWANVMALGNGAHVSVVQTDFRTRSGAITAVSEDSVSLDQPKGPSIQILRTSIIRVQRRASTKRVRNILIGIAAGAGLGVALD